MVSIKWGLQNSDNWVTVYLMGKLSPYTLARMLHSYGLKGHIDPVVSLCLGTCDASISEMVGGYSAFANRGIRTEPLYVSRIEDGMGNVLATFSTQSSEVLTESSTAKMLDMLRAVVDGGTGSRVRGYGVSAPMGGKTGTTQNNSDGWFMGFTPSLVGGVWAGGEDPTIHFDRMAEGQAASIALPVFALFMQKVYADKRLGYSQSENFTGLSGYSLCESSTNTGNDPHGLDEMFE
jgi:penicillin-binding protein 1A